jgi:hypothetical protein
MVSAVLESVRPAYRLAPGQAHLAVSVGDLGEITVIDGQKLSGNRGEHSAEINHLRAFRLA